MADVFVGGARVDHSLFPSVGIGPRVVVAELENQETAEVRIAAAASATPGRSGDLSTSRLLLALNRTLKGEPTMDLDRGFSVSDRKRQRNQRSEEEGDLRQF